MIRSFIAKVSHNSRCAPLRTVNFAKKPPSPVVTAGGTPSSGTNVSLIGSLTVLNPSSEHLLDVLVTVERRKVLAIRYHNPVLRRRTFFRGQVIDHTGVKDLAWIRPDGQEMTAEDWKNGAARAIGMLIHGNATDEKDEHGDLIRGETMLLMVNASDAEVPFALPVTGDGGDGGDGGNGNRRSEEWTTLVDTARPDADSVAERYAVSPFSLVLLRRGTDRRLRATIQQTGSERRKGKATGRV